MTNLSNSEGIPMTEAALWFSRELSPEKWAAALVAEEKRERLRAICMRDQKEAKALDHRDGAEEV